MDTPDVLFAVDFDNPEQARPAIRLAMELLTATLTQTGPDLATLDNLDYRKTVENVTTDAIVVKDGVVDVGLLSSITLTLAHFCAITAMTAIGFKRQDAEVTGALRDEALDWLRNLALAYSGELPR